MSRFFAGGVSDSDYSSSEEELLSSSEEEEELRSESEDEEAEESDDSAFANDSDDSDSDEDTPSGPAYFLKSKFTKGAASDDDSSDEEDGKKVVKSAKDKLLDEIRSAINTIDTSKEDNDWIVVLSEFDKLNRLLIRAQQQNLSTPNIYIKTIAQLDETIQDTQQDKKKLNASVSKAFNTVRQRVKKAVRENSSLVDSFRENPEAFEKEAPITETPSKASTPVPGEGFSTVGKSGKTTESTSFFKTLRSVAESRGKKNVDSREQVKTLETLAEEASTPYQAIIVYLMLIPYRFDGSANLSYLSIDQWKLAAKDINNLFKILEDNKSQYRVTETAEASDDIEVEPTPNSEGVREVVGSVVSFVERLDDEFTRSLQVIDPHTTEYIDRLKDEQELYTTIIRAQLYSEFIIPESEIVSAKGDQIARVVSRRIDHIYFKPSGLIKQSEATAWESLKPTAQTSYIAPYTEEESYIDTLLDSLASILYRQTNAVYRKRAMLSHIYFYAFNNKYFKARDMFLISHLQSSIHTSDPSVQILFNRALVQLGLCAFRNGLISEAHQTLQEIATSTRHKELLGQGAQRYSNQNTVADKQRLLPFHTHINLELLETVFLTSSLLIEIPQYAQLGTSVDAKKRLQTKSFRRTLEYHEKQTFQGPPENTRDYVMTAAKQLQAGNWKKASELLNSIKIWNLFPESDKIRELIKEKLQVEGLRTYIFQFKSFYSKLSIVKLSQIFELSESKVSAVLSKMIFNEEISAGLDQVSKSVVFTKGVELTRLQELALDLADRASSLSDRNERLAGGHQQQQGYHHGGNNAGKDQHNNAHHHKRNQNFKFAPVTGALSSAPGSISGALNGMDKRNNQRGKSTRA
ncbi:hypothetical protein BN7_6417 [Wickerhamomyces ciferrii]|uniref:Eukaryotic translation initiation factor 3 subunit C n=1 Tax=Wickerhamomyces ciferrii (strain ATCC 14091 / BCRC 22168 / CBS 111 / JCM 3599 / NBRC 0793 / NRRL Y-1031 F-60-10) TaxID=1206466 RepID=K0L085_WICCF|nr:uncharacterized protein BN7_6417 [Wickerhamomyces ciferrii]CCH46818.1 hypothetical protein BN7_6417 [Wickerhamomyces ciferrii]